MIERANEVKGKRWQRLGSRRDGFNDNWLCFMIHAHNHTLLISDFKMYTLSLLKADSLYNSKKGNAIRAVTRQSKVNVCEELYCMYESMLNKYK